MFHLLRTSRIHRWYSIQSANPKLRSNIFSIRNLPPKLQDLPLDTYPNPIYNFSKADLLNLEQKELNHLLSIPYKSSSETDKFCFNILEIVHENLMEDPKLAAKYLLAIQDENTRATVMGCLKQYYKSNRLRRSLILFIDSPTSPETRSEVLHTLEKILCDFETLNEDACQMALSFLKKLALTGRHNPHIMFAPQKAVDVLMKSLPESQWAQLYACLLHVNMKFQNGGDFEKLKKSLLRGSNLDKLVVRKGIIDAKWQDTNKFDFDTTYRMKMVSFLTFNDLAFFADHAIREKDVVNANLYLDLLVTKFENLAGSDNQKKRLQVVLNTMLNHSMVFKGPQECLKYLNYMVESNLEVRPSTLLRILVNLREVSCWDEALFLINYLHTEKLDGPQRKILTREIMKVITQKFARHPQVAVGYFASMFNRDNPLQLLKDLHILDVIYGPSTLFDNIKKADIHEDLTEAHLTHHILKDMYLVVLCNVPEKESNVDLIKDLFCQYLIQIEQAKGRNSTQSIFHPNNVCDDILCLFLDQLVRVDPFATDNMDLVTDPARFAAAKDICTQFFAIADLQKHQRKGYLLDLMLTSSLLYHRDIAFGAQLLKHAREVGMPLSFNQLYPFIMYHYSNGQHEEARKWYDLLTANGVKAKNVSADRLVEIAKELDWPVKGTQYRSTARQKNRKAREELVKLTTDPLAMFSEASVAGDISDLNLLEELGSILHSMRVEKKRREGRKEIEDEELNIQVIN